MYLFLTYLCLSLSVIPVPESVLPCKFKTSTQQYLPSTIPTTSTKAEAKDKNMDIDGQGKTN